MMFQSILPSASTLLLLATQFAALTSGVALPDEHVQMMNRRDWYDNVGKEMLAFHREKAREYNDYVAEYDRKMLAKRQDYDWHPSKGWSSGWGYHSFWASKNCESGSRKWYWGTLIRTITYPDPDATRLFTYWQNKTWYEVDLPTGNPTQCYRYGQPNWNYHTSTGDNKMCIDKIYNPSSQTWTNRSSSNTNTGWSTNNSTYGGQTVRTIWDCLLNRTAVEYQNNHPALGYKPVRYTLDGERYYRFYDDNQFAWFLGCPNDWVAKLKKRECFGCPPGSNPIWDFMPEKLHNPLADATPLEWYSGDISNYSTNRINTISWWPPLNTRNVTIEGRVCTQVAVSRPGLRHWTVKFFTEHEDYYPQKTKEWSWPSAWTDLGGETYATDTFAS
ncbi:hypothetical protein ABW19_dt0205758 [Dactylella cylindrospora]|nr:hypothetical protein ABW19_dt0205758 [Dactylella cylindrospora]